MAMSKQEIVAFGDWLRTEREKRLYRGVTLSADRLARLFPTYILSERLPVNVVKQQQISQLENATLVTGPKRPQPWWSVLREFIESGKLDELLTAIEGPQPAPDGAVVIDFGMAKLEHESDTIVRTPDGREVGKIVWGKIEKR
jgi:hypothetical protein